MPKRYKLDFDGDEISRQITLEMTRRVRRCCLIVLARAKELLGVEGAGVGPSGKLIYGANPSRPGEAPHKQRGHLLRSVAFEVVKLVGRVGTNLPYGRILELGSRLVRPRPWLRRALRECQEAVRRILGAPMRF